MSGGKILNQGQARPKPKPQHVLSMAEVTRKPSPEPRSSDPYNTSGSFDRKKNWARVGKR